jgi:hypothetical protein
LDGVGAGGDLAAQVGVDQAGQPPEQGVPGVRMPVHERLGARVVACAAALDQVRGERERSAAEADQRHASAQSLAGAAHGVVDEGQRLVGVVRGEAGNVVRRLHGPSHHRSVAAAELDAGAERLEHQQDIGEDDRRVDPQPLDGGDGHLGRGLRVVAELEEAEALAYGAVLGHVTARLPHEPDRRERCRLAPAGLQERVRVQPLDVLREAPEGVNTARQGARGVLS